VGKIRGFPEGRETSNILLGDPRGKQKEPKETLKQSEGRPMVADCLGKKKKKPRALRRKEGVGGTRWGCRPRPGAVVAWRGVAKEIKRFDAREGGKLFLRSQSERGQLGGKGLGKSEQTGGAR